MKADVKAEWLRRLRDPETKQAQGALVEIKANDAGKETMSFCCLGVLMEQCTDLAERRGLRYYPKDEEGNVLKMDGASSTLLSEVADELRLADTNPSVNVYPDDDVPEAFANEWEFPDRDKDNKPCKRVSLAELNDYGLTFVQIAKLIEREIPED